MRKVQLRKGLISNGSTDKQKRIKDHLISIGTEDSEAGEHTEGEDAKRDRS